MDRSRRSGARTDVTLLVVLCIFLVATLAWASVAEVELAAVAPGRIVPEGQVKTIRSFEHGKIKQIAVTEGSVVEKDDVLVEFDSTLVDAEIAKLTRELAVKSVEAARLNALLGWRQGKPFHAPDGAPREIAAINRQVLTDQIAAHQAHLDELDDLAEERQAHVQAIVVALAKHKKLLPILRERTEMRETLYRKNLGAKLDLLKEQERLLELEGTIALRQKDLVRTKASLAAMRVRKERTVSEFFWKNRIALAAVRERISVLHEDIRQALEHRARHTLVAPVDGVVQDLAVHTEDGMVEPGARLMVIVPGNARMRVEAFVSNADIGFVKPGQRVTLKITTFDFRRYGAISGTVSHVGRDATNAGALTGDQPTPGVAAGVSRVPSQGQSNPTGPVFKALIELDQTYMEIEGRRMDLLPGMSAEAAVILGKQRIIEYVLQPLRGYRQDAFREN